LSIAVTAAGNLRVVGDAQGNEIVIESTSGGALRVSSLDGTTTINGGSSPFSTTAVTGDVDVFMKQGDDVVDVGGTGTQTTLPHNLLINMGTGNDTVAVTNASITGNVVLFARNGSDTFTIGGSSSDTGVTVGGSVLVVGATGSGNTIAVFDATITGDLRIESSGANDQIQVGFDAGLGIIGEEQPAHVSIGGNLEINTPSGDYCFSHDGFGCGDFSFDFDGGSRRGGWDGGDGWHSRSGSFGLGSSLANDLAFLRGWGSDGWGGDDGDSWGGGWGGNDGGDCGAHDHSASGNADVSVADVSVTGNVKIHTGSGNDQILLGAAPNVSKVPLNLVFGPVTVGGNLNVKAGNGNNTVVLDDTSVTGNTGLKTGSGEDHIAILGNSASFTGSVKINSGAGDDKIAIINSATFHNSVTVKAGRGNDVMWIAQSLFEGSVTLDGGPGTNTLLQSQTIFPNSFTPGNPVLNSIQVNMPDVSPTDAIVTTNFGWLNTLLGI
jgi:hypothetical protein